MGIVTGRRGMAPVVLIVLIAWALLSVLFLTGTLLAARSIDRSVAVVKPNVIEIEQEGRFIGEAKKIADATVKIRSAAAPLTGHLARTLTTARGGIDPKLKSVLSTVGGINETAGSINTTVLQIGSTVDQIFSSASSISGSVGGIRSSANSINASTKSINASARSILGRAGGVLDRVNSIDRGVAAINTRAERIQSVGTGIGSDLSSVQKLVGIAGTGGHRGTIHGHANAIDCSPALVSPASNTSGAFGDLLGTLLQGSNPRGGDSMFCGK